MINKYAKLSERQIYLAMIIVVFVGKLYAVLTYGPDGALFPNVYNAKFCTATSHCWTFPTSVPYSILWYWINLFWLIPDTVNGRFLYGVYVIVLDAVLTTIYWRTDRIPKRYLALLEVFSAMFYLGQGSEYQNVTILAFYPLAFYNPWFLIIPILVKLPLGWSWNLSDIHVQCVYQCGGWFYKHDPVYLLGLLILNYGVLLFAWEWTLEQTSPRFRRLLATFKRQLRGFLHAFRI